jgi:hypothetical protein
MYFNEHLFKILKQFEELPDSEEKTKTASEYLADEISAFELADKARKLIEKTKNENKKHSIRER